MVNAWNRIFSEKGDVFTEPHSGMERLEHILRRKGGKKVLDLGCGTGRHLLFFAQKGYEVHGLDESPEALRRAKLWLTAKGFKANLKQQSFYEKLPYEDDFFDCVVSTNAIHHGMRYEVEDTVEEAARVLKKGGLIFAVVPSDEGRKQKNMMKSARKIAKNTFFPTEGDEAGLIHFIFDKTSIYDIFYPFMLEIWKDCDGYWCILGEKE